MTFVMLTGILFVNHTALAAQEEQSNVVKSTEISTNDSEEIISSSSSEKNSSNTDEKIDSSPVVEVSEPTLSGVVNKTIKLGEKFDPKANVTATDSQDGDLTSKIKVTGSVDTNKVGEYSLAYSVKNAAGKEATRTSTIHVQAPEAGTDIEPAQEVYDVEVPELTLPRYADYKQAIKDKMVIKNSRGEIISPEKVTISITSAQGTTKVGNATVLLEVSQENGLVQAINLKMAVISGIVIEQPDIHYLFYVGDKKEEFDPYMFFDAYEVGIDNKQVKLGQFDAKKKMGIEVVENPVDFSKAGTYTVRYKITNSLGEEVYHSYNVIVREKAALKLLVTDKVMYVGDKLTEDMILNWADTENAEQIAFEVLDDEIEVDSVTDQLLAVGTYKIRFTATKKDEGTGAETSTQAEMILTVKERDGQKPTLTGEPTAISNSTNTKKVLPQKSLPASSAAKNLPKTGSEKVRMYPAMMGVIVAGTALFFLGKNYRNAKR